MRNALAGLLLAVGVLVVALVGAALGSLGVAAVGWLLASWFGLTPWQGSLVALALTLAILAVLCRLLAPPPTIIGDNWADWDEDAANQGERPL